MIGTRPGTLVALDVTDVSEDLECAMCMTCRKCWPGNHWCNRSGTTPLAVQEREPVAEARVLAGNSPVHAISAEAAISVEVEVSAEAGGPTVDEMVVISSKRLDRSRCKR